MHESAMANAERFVRLHLSRHVPGRVLDVGSRDVNGTLRPLLQSAGWDYVGLDRIAGTNVDVHTPELPWPLADVSFGAVVSSSALEHDPQPWVTWREMCRVLAPGGLLYCCCPSAGPHHDYPVDCWRFMVDAWAGLAEWGGLDLIEAYVDPSDPVHRDSVGIFRKPF